MEMANQALLKTNCMPGTCYCVAVGKDCNAKGKVLVPAVALPTIFTAPLNSTVVGWKTAKPLESEVTTLSDEDNTIGMGSGVMVVSPAEAPEAVAPSRSIVEWNTTAAPCTGFGGVEKSTTRTMTG